MIDSAASADQLRRRLKREELEQYGAPFTPEFVYEAIKKLPRFDSMQVSIHAFVALHTRIKADQNHSVVINKMRKNFLVFCFWLFMRNARL